MEHSIEKQILNKIKKAKRGTFYFNETFLAFGNAKAVSKAMERLTIKGELYRVTLGIYLRPNLDAKNNPITPSIDALAAVIAKKDETKILPTGAYAQYKLGLIAQMPLNVVLLNIGVTRALKIGKTKVIFKRTTPKNLSLIGPISGLAVQVLKSLGKNNVSSSKILKIQEQLRKEKTAFLKHDMALVSEWMRAIMQSALKENSVKKSKKSTK